MNHANEQSMKLYTGAAIADARGSVQGGAVLLEQRGETLEVLASGPREEVRVHPGCASAEHIDRPRSVLIPGLVNAHTHLDLTHVGPLDYADFPDFAAWLMTVGRARLTEDEPIADSVLLGIEKSLRGGTVAVGDIAGIFGFEPIRKLRASPLFGVSYQETFGRGVEAEPLGVERQQRLVDEIAGDEGGVRLGLSPHAPYSAGLRVHEQAIDFQRAHGVPYCTHLAESPPEREFVGKGTGPIRDFFGVIGFWHDSMTDDLGREATPIEYMTPALRLNGIDGALMVHVNDCSDDDLRVLAQAGVHVAYCPRSSDYFAQHEAFGLHRYMDMLDAGINVCLGTDSIINIPVEQADRLSVLDEMRFLSRRDGTSPQTLLAMGTTYGAK
ncbi:MAG: amidohydrolase family protein, partial [Planctomycetota bacterium]